jgi:putative ABC transport system permease protein
MGTLWQDIRYGFRMLSKNARFTWIVVLTLAVGIGANAAIFSVVNAVLLRPLPFEASDRLVQVLTRFEDPKLRRLVEIMTQGKGDTVPVNTLFDYSEIRKRNHVFGHIAAIEVQPLVAIGGDEPLDVLGARVSVDFFNCLGFQPMLGRGFHQEDDQPTKDHVVVLSHQYWKRHCAADPNIIGQNITFKQGAHTVIGVMPPHLRFLEYGDVLEYITPLAEHLEVGDIDVWQPLTLSAERLGPGSMYSPSAWLIARLKSNVALEQAQTELNVISSQLTQEYQQRGKRSFILTKIHERAVAKVRPALWMLMGSVGFVLLIACTNVANMLLARFLSRQREVAIRAALGAGRLRLIRQFLTESFILSLMGGLCALLLTVWSLSLMKALLPSTMPRLSEIRIDGWVLGFVLFVSICTGMMIGLASVLRLSEIGVGQYLKKGCFKIRGGSRRNGLHRILLVSEVGLSLMLLIGAVLMIKSFWRLTNVDLGFEPRHVLVVGTKFDASLKDRIEQLPGVETVAFGSPCINLGGQFDGFDIAGRDTSIEVEKPRAKFIEVGEDYFTALRIPLRMGRSFTENDHGDAERVAIINQTIVRRYFADTSPLDQTLKCGGKPHRIIGVVADVRPNGFRSDVMPTIYLPFAQADWFGGNIDLIVRARGAPERLFAQIRREFLSMNPNSPAPRIRTLEELLAGPVAPMYFNTQLLSLFAVVALFLVSVGTYGLTAFFVSQRTQEIGIRMALGARTTDVLRSVVGQELKLTLIGIGFGLAGAFALTRVTANLLYDTSPTDPMTFISGSLVLIGVALLASYIPARRVSRIDPMVALRYE